MKYLALILLVGLMGCSENYRYPCQDPKNWEESICQKPYCSANGTCPEDLKHYEKDGVIVEPMPSSVPNKGDCK